MNRFCGAAAATTQVAQDGLADQVAVALDRHGRTERDVGQPIGQQRPHLRDRGHAG